MKMLIQHGDKSWQGEHVHTLPGHRVPTDEEIEKYVGVKKGTKQFKEWKKIAGVNRYVVIMDGKYVLFPMDGTFKVTLQ